MAHGPIGGLVIGRRLSSAFAAARIAHRRPAPAGRPLGRLAPGLQARVSLLGRQPVELALGAAGLLIEAGQRAGHEGAPRPRGGVHLPARIDRGGAGGGTRRGLGRAVRQDHGRGGGGRDRSPPPAIAGLTNRGAGLAPDRLGAHQYRFDDPLRAGSVGAGEQGHGVHETGVEGQRRKESGAVAAEASGEAAPDGVGARGRDLDGRAARGQETPPLNPCVRVH